MTVGEFWFWLQGVHEFNEEQAEQMKEQ